MSKYSIFIPAYNSTEFIENFCKNIKKQIIKPDQIIIVDDTKNLPDFEKKIRENLNFLDLDNKIIIIKNKKNMKPSRSWNNCLNLFSNKLIFRMDVDDIWREDHTKKMLDAYNNNKNAALFLQKFQCNFFRKIFFNYKFLFTNQGLHSSCLFNFNVIKVKYPIIDLPLDDLYLYIKLKYILKKKIQFVNFTTCFINIDHSNRWSSNSDKLKTLKFEKKLYFLALKKFLHLKKLNFFNFIKIITKLNIFESFFIVFKILIYYKNK